LYTKIESQFWKDEKMVKMSCDARYLMLYFLTSPQRNIIGCYFIPEPYACFDTGISTERFRQAMTELVAAGRIKYDQENHILLIPNFLKFNKLDNPKQVKAAIDRLNELPKTQLFQDISAAIETIDKPYIKPFAERLQERLQERLPIQEYSNKDTGYSIKDKGDSNNTRDILLVPDCSGTEEETAEVEVVGKRKRTSYTYEPEHMEIAERLKYRILDHKPNFKCPSNLDQWANTIRLMDTQDKRSIEEIAAVIDFCQQDNFWRVNILSADKLREKFDQLQAKMQAKRTPPAQPGYTEGGSRLAMLENAKRRLASGN